MSFPKYEHYKDSGVEWLGEVPAHWVVNSLGRIATERCDGPFGSGITSDHYTEYGAQVVRLQNIKAAGYYHGEPVFIDLSYFEDSLFRHGVEPDDLLIAGLGDENNLVGRACVAPEGISPALVKADCFRFRLNRTVASPGFIAFQLCISAECDGGRISTGSTRSRIPLSVMASRKVALPSLEEQHEIFSFLTRETTKLDALITEQRTLIDLLKEKRQAVISHAVTKGLDPRVPMKDSGVEWLGEVPAHWEVGALKRFFTILDGRRVPLSAEERGSRSGDFPYYGASGIIDYIDDFIFDEDLILVSEDGANLLSRSTPIAFVARGSYWVNNHAHILKPMDDNLAFWSERIECIDLVPFITGSAQPKLTIDALQNLMIAAPREYEERALISAHITKEATQLDALTAEAKTTIALLQERRGALISAAVTGKIDVRQAA